MSIAYNKGIAYLNDSGNSWSGSNGRVLLVNNLYSADRNDEYVSDVSAYEVDGAGYSRKSLSSLTVSINTTTHKIKLDGSDVSWSGLDVGVVAAAILYVNVTNDADSILLAYIDTGGFPINTAISNLTIRWNTNGIIEVWDVT